MSTSPLPMPTSRTEADRCSVVEGCITCGDVAVPLTVIEVVGSDARCRDDSGREESVATELVGDVRPGFRLLVHAGVAIELLEEEGSRHALQ